MSRIARLPSHHSFGATSSLKRQKNLLIKRVYTVWLIRSSSYSLSTTIRHQIDIKLTNSSSKLSSEQQATKTENSFHLVSR